MIGFALTRYREKRSDFVKGNIYKKTYRENKGERRFCCTHARLGWLRMDKKAEKKQWRRFMKSIMENWEG